MVVGRGSRVVGRGYGFLGTQTIGSELSGFLRPMTDDLRPSVVVVGGASVDVIGRSTAPTQPGVSNPGRVRISPGGAGRNVAENMARLGARVSLISGVGAGPLGDWLIDRTSVAGVDVTHILRVAGKGSYYVGIDTDSGPQWAVSDMGAVESVLVEEIEARAERIRTADAVVLDANLVPDTIRRVVALAAGLVCLLPVSVAKSVRVRDVLERSSLMALTSREAEALTGRAARTPGQILDAGRELQSRGPSVVVITAGDQGMVWIGRDVIWARVVPPSTVDSTGAGDAVAAVAVYSMLTGIDEDLAARLAAAAGAMTVGVEGATHPELTREALNHYAELAKSL